MLCKKTFFISILSFMTTLACFARGAGSERNSNISMDHSMVTNTPTQVASSGMSWVDVLCPALIVLVILVVVYLIYVACQWVHEKLSNFERELKNIKNIQPRNQTQLTSNSVSRDDINTLRAEVNNILKNQHVVIENQNAIDSHNNDNANNIKEKIEKIFQEVSTQRVSCQLAACLEGIKSLYEKIQEINGSKEDISNIAARLTDIKTEFNQLCAEQPSVIRFAIANAIEVIQTCQEMNLTQTENIRNAGLIWNTYKELQFESGEELALCKKYYDSRNEHQKISEDKEAAEAKFNQLKLRFDKQAEDMIRISQHNDSLQQNIENLKNEIESISAAKHKLENIQKVLFPEVVDTKALLDVLKDESESICSAVTISLIQLYWYAKISKANPNNIKSAFTKFDDTLYEIFAARQEILQDIRQAVQSLINEEIFKDTPYKITWPRLGESASENENNYNRENDEGNEICKVRSAIVFNSGNVESVARIYTKI